MVVQVSEDMTVYDLRRFIAEMIQVPTVHILVGASWAADLLDHVGRITDRTFPFTTIPCPYLQHRSVLNIYLNLPQQLPLTPERTTYHHT
jgi:hypothetical protein